MSTFSFSRQAAEQAWAATELAASAAYDASMATAMQAWNTAESAAWAQYQGDRLAAVQAWAIAADAAMVEYYADVAIAATTWNTGEASYRATLAANVANAESAWDTDEGAAFATFEGAVGSEAGDYRQTLEEPWTVSQVTQTLAAANAPDARQLAAATSTNHRTSQTPPPPIQQAPNQPNVGRAGEAIGGLTGLWAKIMKTLGLRPSPKDIPGAVKDVQNVVKGTDSAIQAGGERAQFMNRLEHGILPGDPLPPSSPSSGQPRRSAPTP